MSENEETKEIKGYKATTWRRICFPGEIPMRYKAGETYELPYPENMGMCAWGFHFCKKLADVFYYYGARAGTRLFKVTALGRTEVLERRIVECNTGYSPFCTSFFTARPGKCVTDKIRIDRELTRDEVLEVLREELRKGEGYPDHDLFRLLLDEDRLNIERLEKAYKRRLRKKGAAGK